MTRGPVRRATGLAALPDGHCATPYSVEPLVKVAGVQLRITFGGKARAPPGGP